MKFIATKSTKINFMQFSKQIFPLSSSLYFTPGKKEFHSSSRSSTETDARRMNWNSLTLHIASQRDSKKIKTSVDFIPLDKFEISLDGNTSDTYWQWNIAFESFWTRGQEGREVKFHENTIFHFLWATFFSFRSLYLMLATIETWISTRKISCLMKKKTAKIFVAE